MKRLRVAMIGYGFMGAAHSQGWRTAPRVFDLPVEMERLQRTCAAATDAISRRYFAGSEALAWKGVGA